MVPAFIVLGGNVIIFLHKLALCHFDPFVFTQGKLREKSLSRPRGGIYLNRLKISQSLRFFEMTPFLQVGNSLSKSGGPIHPSADLLLLLRRSMCVIRVVPVPFLQLLR
jgi:hypothetical protein